MIIITFLAAVIAAVAIVLLVRKYSSFEFVAHARLLFRAWSVWLTGIGTLLGVYLASAPDTIISAWNALPPDLKAMLPVNIAQYVSYFIVALGVIAQFIRQQKLVDRKQQMDGQQ